MNKVPSPRFLLLLISAGEVETFGLPVATSSSGGQTGDVSPVRGVRPTGRSHGGRCSTRLCKFFCQCERTGESVSMCDGCEHVTVTWITRAIIAAVNLAGESRSLLFTTHGRLFHCVPMYGLCSCLFSIMHECTALLSLLFVYC